MLLIAGALSVQSCDKQRLYEKNQDFPQRHWLVTNRPEFTFEIPDTTLKYNVYLNVRNESAFANANLYFNYALYDSLQNQIAHKLVSEFLFDEKSGRPLGTSGLGDIYDHRFLLLKDYRFAHPGNYTVQVEQFMRTDTLRGILAVGLRVEKAENEQ
jgi:gliding motility-associated lipoprotein GldH